MPADSPVTTDAAAVPSPVVTGWQAALERTVTGLGFDLVDVERSAGGLLRVTIDRLPGRAYASGPGEFVLVDDCELVTRQLQYVLEVEGCDYARLEVSSPGLDRPLRKPADWQRFVGSEVEISLRQAFQGRKKWRGTLMAGAGEQAWRLALPPELPARKPGQPLGKKAAAAAAKAAADPSLVMDFNLDEVRDARLVPVVDFKGRRDQAMPADAGVPTGAPADDQTDGGQT